jgi:hypothetical protein
VSRLKDVRVTGLARMAGISPKEIKTAPVNHVVHVAPLSKQQLTVER